MSALASNRAPLQYIPLVVEALREMQGSGKAAAVKEWIANKLTAEGKVIPDTVLASGASKFTNDIQWARMYLVNAQILENKETSGHGVWKLTPRGWEVPLDPASALQIYEASSQRATSVGGDDQEAPEDGQHQTSIPATKTWEYELHKTLTSMPDKGFERLCAYLMSESGMQATVTGKTGDGGVDGEGLLPVGAFSFVKLRVAWQCKRYKDTNVSSKEIRDFRGAIDGRAQYGIFFTTSTFTLNARAEAGRAGATPIELVDLKSLIDLMGEKGIGLASGAGHEGVRAMDPDFFYEYLHPTGQSSTAQAELI